MNSAEKQAVLHCLKSMIDEEVCEECPLYGTTGTDHCEKDCVRLAINALSSSENPNKWIPVSERLPEKYTYTLWCASSGYVRSDYFNGEFWEDAKKYCYEVVAWMPLPESYVPDINIGKMSEIPTGSEGSDKE